jgi:hypothetical protein
MAKRIPFSAQCSADKYCRKRENCGSGLSTILRDYLHTEPDGQP